MSKKLQIDPMQNLETAKKNATLNEAVQNLGRQFREEIKDHARLSEMKIRKNWPRNVGLVVAPAKSHIKRR